jgi:hypothetical protein
MGAAVLTAKMFAIDYIHRDRAAIVVIENAV